MPNVNTALRYVPGATKNEDLVDLTDECAEVDNAEFLARVAERLKRSRDRRRAGTAIDREGVACIGLLGGYGLDAYRLRLAQEAVRFDRMPSYWSHAFLIATPLSIDPEVNRDPDHSPWVWESSLRPGERASMLNQWMGAGPRRVAEYASAAFDPASSQAAPNMAVIAIALTDEERERVLAFADKPYMEQLAFDLQSLQSAWFHFLRVGEQSANPLAAGHAVHSAAYVQMAYDAAGIDLAPGAVQRNIAPEHIWAAAMWMSDGFTVPDPRRRRTASRRVRGWYVTRDKAAVPLPPERRMPLSVRDATA